MNEFTNINECIGYNFILIYSVFTETRTYCAYFIDTLLRTVIYARRTADQS